MAVTLSRRPLTVANRTTVPRVQPNPQGGRPADPLTLAFEGDLEGLIATRDDAVAIQLAVVQLNRYQSVAAMVAQRACSLKSTDADRKKLHALNAITRRLIIFLAERSRRLSDVIVPELQRITAQTGAVLDFRERLR